MIKLPGKRFILAAAIGLLTACKHKSMPETQIVHDTLFYCRPSIVGVWQGYAENQRNRQPINMVFKTGGSMHYEDSIRGIHNFCTGTWELRDSTVIVTTVCLYGYKPFVGIRQRFEGTFSVTNGGVIRGGWENLTTATESDGGSFFLTKEY